MKIVYNCLKTTDADNIRIELAKCQFSKIAVEWLFEYCFTHETKCFSSPKQLYFLHRKGRRKWKL